MSPAPALRLCFVCLGNICRSPSAEAVMRGLLLEAGLQAHIEVDSAGTAGWHVGEPADPRSRAAAGRRGLRLDHRAWQLGAADLARFDYVLAMDAANLAALRALAEGRMDAPVIALLRSFDAAAPPDAAVPDPYYGGAEGFEQVLDLCESACRGLLGHLRARHGL